METMEDIKESAVLDGITKFLDEAGSVRGEIVSLEDEWQKMTAFQHYPLPVSRLLGEFTAGAVLLSGTIKFNGALILQVKGDGPVKMVVVEVRSNGTVRAMAKLAEGAEIAEDAGLQSLINRNGRGQCAIILDPYDRIPGTQPYQGVVALTGDRVASVLEGYMRQSEQLETSLWLTATDKKLAGLLVQKMPGIGGTAKGGSDEDTYNRLTQLAATITDKELLGLPRTEVLRRLFWQESIRSLEEKAMKFDCNCTRERTDAMLKSLGRKELEDILRDEGKIQVTCQFCNKTQTYSPEDVALLFEDAASEEVPSEVTEKTVH
jgi:molecular chaperone Hsp33